MHASRLGRSLRLSVIEGGLATAMGSLFSGVFLIGLALALGASRFQIGILFTLPSLASVAQIAGSYWIERGGNCRKICLRMSAVSRLLYIPVLVLLLALPLPSEKKVWGVIGVMALSDMFGSLGGVAWLSWIKGLVPSRVRVPFFARRNLVNTLISFGICLVCGAMVDRLNAAAGGKPLGFIIAFAIAMACGFIGWLLLARIPDARVRAPKNQNPSAVPFRQLLAGPLRQTNFRRMISFYAVWNMAVNFAAPFIPVFLLQKLGLSIWMAVALNTVNCLTGMAANGFWSKLAQRFGLKPVVFIATLGDAFFPLLLIFVEGPWTWALLVIHLLGVFNAPIGFAPDNFILKLSPRNNASSYMAVYRTVIGLVTALAATLGGYLAESQTGFFASGGLIALGGLKIVFLVSFVGRIASLALLAGVYEPSALPIGAMIQSLMGQRRSPVLAMEEAIPPAENRSELAASEAMPSIKYAERGSAKRPAIANTPRVAESSPT